MGVDSAIDITTEQRETILALLEEHLPDTAAWVYGSRVMWTSRPQSDLDLVVFATPEQKNRVGDFRKAFEESTLPFRVDLFVWETIPESFRKSIQKDHVVLVAADGESHKRRNPSVPVRWSERLLGELTENFDAARIPIRRGDRRSGPYPYYGASGIVDRIDKYIFDGEYLLIAEDGENLRTRNTAVAFLANGKFWVNNHAHIVRGNHEAHTRYLMYALSEMDLSGYLTGSTMPKLTQANLNRRINETLEAMAQALFKSWFVEFDPVRAKTAGSDPGLPKHLADLFPDRLVESELGEIPESWVIFHLDELAVQHTKSMSPYAFPEANFEHFSILAHDKDLLPAID